MASMITDWGASQFLSMTMGLITPPFNFYAALVSQEPGPQTDGSLIAAMEPNPAFGYNRVAVPSGASNWSDPDGVGFTANLNPITFDVPTGVWGVAAYFCLCDASTAGDVYLYGEFDVPAYLDPTYQYVIPAGGVVISLTSLLSSIVAL